ncbi:DUF3750 domain-containing protein [Methylobrevis pamukkalensis]|uniref:DUF3750 domain-containing protein n=1 Tax=Methylobrevis pamukkalensis TaxID=1439726 RepID=A0A1E3H0G6_9HYPH|nr:DUF3750 domain-containing protein [Methylobrevis pamukkalensis]ODN69813.1 hypothetical protein A6302_02853 [Methylobrevis pamukkalensis]
MRRFALLVLLVLFVLPLSSHALWRWTSGWPGTWSGADWSSAGILPAAAVADEAVVHVMAARVGNWRSIFAHHSWVVMKPAGAATYTRYDVVGWGEPVRTNHRVPDGRWYGNEPEILLTLTGPAAADAVPAITRAVADYPHGLRGSYRAWPGPNSNTFVAHLASEVPALAPALLPTALGKDYRGSLLYAGRSVSGTGLQVSLGGVFGVTLGWVEGAELNLLGLVAGLDLRRPALKLPGWGRLGMAPA